MDITVYLPDEIGERAKAATLPFSRLLRDAVEAELERADALAQAVEGMTPQREETTDRDRTVILRFTGRALAGDNETTIYQTDSGSIVMVDPEGYTTWDSAEEYGEWLSNPMRNNLGGATEHVATEAAEELDIPVVIDL